MAATDSDYSSYDSGSSFSSSLDFIPRFGGPSLFPYHAIGGSVDAGHYADASTAEASLCLTRYSNKGSKSSTVSDLHSLDYSIHRQQSLVGSVILSRDDIELLAGLEDASQWDDDSLGGCSDLTSSTRASLVSGAQDEQQAVQADNDFEVWQQWQSSFTASKTPLIEDDGPEKEDRMQERHRVLKDTLAPISENIHEEVGEDDVAVFMKAVANNISLLPAPLKRDHSLGGSPVWSSGREIPGYKSKESRERAAAWQQYQAKSVRSKTPLLCPEEEDSLY